MPPSTNSFFPSFGAGNRANVTLKFSSKLQIQDVVKEVFAQLTNDAAAQLSANSISAGSPVSAESPLGAIDDYGLFAPSVGKWLEPKQQLSFYDFRSGENVELKNVFRMLRVRFPDMSVRTVCINETKNVSALTSDICQKIEIRAQTEYSLAFDDPSRFKYKTLHYAEDAFEWLKSDKTLSEQHVKDFETLILAKRYFFTDSQLEQADVHDANFLYHFCRSAIVTGRLPCGLADAVTLAAIAAAITGITPTALASAVANTSSSSSTSASSSSTFVLDDYFSKEYRKVKDIDKRVLVELSKLEKVPELVLKHRYVMICTGFKLYGSTFFFGKEKHAKQSKLVNVLIAVQSSGLHRVDPETFEILQSWTLSQIKRWTFSASAFSLDFGDHDTKKGYSIQTTRGEQINALIHGYVKLIVARKEELERMAASVNSDDPSRILTTRKSFAPLPPQAFRTSDYRPTSFTTDLNLSIIASFDSSDNYSSSSLPFSQSQAQRKHTTILRGIPPSSESSAAVILPTQYAKASIAIQSIANAPPVSQIADTSETQVVISSLAALFSTFLATCNALLRYALDLDTLGICTEVESIIAILGPLGSCCNQFAQNDEGAEYVNKITKLTAMFLESVKTYHREKQQSDMMSSYCIQIKNAVFDFLCYIDAGFLPSPRLLEKTLVSIDYVQSALQNFESANKTMLKSLRRELIPDEQFGVLYNHLNTSTVHASQLYNTLQIMSPVITFLPCLQQVQIAIDRISTSLNDVLESFCGLSRYFSSQSTGSTESNNEFSLVKKTARHVELILKHFLKQIKGADSYVDLQVQTLCAEVLQTSSNFLSTNEKNPKKKMEHSDLLLHEVSDLIHFSKAWKDSIHQQKVALKQLDGSSEEYKMNLSSCKTLDSLIQYCGSSQKQSKAEQTLDNLEKQLQSLVEVKEHLVDSLKFQSGGNSDPLVASYVHESITKLQEVVKKLGFPTFDSLPDVVSIPLQNTCAASTILCYDLSGVSPQATEVSNAVNAVLDCNRHYSNKIKDMNDNEKEKFAKKFAQQVNDLITQAKVMEVAMIGPNESPTSNAYIKQDLATCELSVLELNNAIDQIAAFKDYLAIQTLQEQISQLQNALLEAPVDAQNNENKTSMRSLTQERSGKQNSAASIEKVSNSDLGALLNRTEFRKLSAECKALSNTNREMLAMFKDPKRAEPMAAVFQDIFDQIAAIQAIAEKMPEKKLALDLCVKTNAVFEIAKSNGEVQEKVMALEEAVRHCDATIAKLPEAYRTVLEQQETFSEPQAAVVSPDRVFRNLAESSNSFVYALLLLLAAKSWNAHRERDFAAVEMSFKELNTSFKQYSAFCKRANEDPTSISESNLCLTELEPQEKTEREQEIFKQFQLISKSSAEVLKTARKPHVTENDNQNDMYDMVYALMHKLTDTLQKCAVYSALCAPDQLEGFVNLASTFALLTAPFSPMPISKRSKSKSSKQNLSGDPEIDSNASRIPSIFESIKNALIASQNCVISLVETSNSIVHGKKCKELCDWLKLIAENVASATFLMSALDLDTLQENKSNLSFCLSVFERGADQQQVVNTLQSIESSVHRICNLIQASKSANESTATECDKLNAYARILMSDFQEMATKIRNFEKSSNSNLATTCLSSVQKLNRTVQKIYFFALESTQDLREKMLELLHASKSVMMLRVKSNTALKKQLGEEFQRANALMQSAVISTTPAFRNFSRLVDLAFRGTTKLDELLLRVAAEGLRFSLEDNEPMYVAINCLSTKVVEYGDVSGNEHESGSAVLKEVWNVLNLVKDEDSVVFQQLKGVLEAFTSVFIAEINALNHEEALRFVSRCKSISSTAAKKGMSMPPLDAFEDLVRTVGRLCFVATLRKSIIIAGVGQPRKLNNQDTKQPGSENEAKESIEDLLKQLMTSISEVTSRQEWTSIEEDSLVGLFRKIDAQYIETISFTTEDRERDRIKKTYRSLVETALLTVADKDMRNELLKYATSFITVCKMAQKEIRRPEALLSWIRTEVLPNFFDAELRKKCGPLDLQIPILADTDESRKNALLSRLHARSTCTKFAESVIAISAAVAQEQGSLMLGAAAEGCTDRLRDLIDCVEKECSYELSVQFRQHLLEPFIALVDSAQQGVKMAMAVRAEVCEDVTTKEQRIVENLTKLARKLETCNMQLTACTNEEQSSIQEKGQISSGSTSLERNIASEQSAKASVQREFETMIKTAEENFEIKQMKEFSTALLAGLDDDTETNAHLREMLTTITEMRPLLSGLLRFASKCQFEVSKQKTRKSKGPAPRPPSEHKFDDNAPISPQSAFHTEGTWVDGLLSASNVVLGDSMYLLHSLHEYNTRKVPRERINACCSAILASVTQLLVAAMVRCDAQSTNFEELNTSGKNLLKVVEKLSKVANSLPGGLKPQKSEATKINSNAKQHDSSQGQQKSSSANMGDKTGGRNEQTAAPPQKLVNQDTADSNTNEQPLSRIAIIQARTEVLAMERQLENARQKYTQLQKMRYMAQ